MQSINQELCIYADGIKTFMVHKLTQPSWIYTSLAH